ncbi:hypothetical protein NDU88_004656 [Pleurodeles waltl]|uniref:Uncharacterized protein n=1 Tax=Pleurodeles waltl TaxID=8319 RepID=A0AAV7PD76_PLEWA|nr:hypothetical protein NDU88_004656 [Pleurodeles waltl]
MYGCQSTDEYYNTACKPTCLHAQEVCLRLLGNRTRLAIRERKGNWTRAGARRSWLLRNHSCKQDACWSVLFLVAGILHVRSKHRAADKATGQCARGASLEINETHTVFPRERE